MLGNFKAAVCLLCSKVDEVSDNDKAKYVMCGYKENIKLQTSICISL